MELKIELPECGKWDLQRNFAENLRSAVGGGCVPTGVPTVALADAGVECVALGDRLLTVGDDRHELRIDGVGIGSLGAPFRALLEGDGSAIVFTDAGPEWIDGTTLHGSAPCGGIGLSVEASGRLSAQVVLPAMTGTYPRSEGELSASDVAGVLAAVVQTAGELENRGARLGVGVQPKLVGWRMVDVDGRVVAVGEPQMLGAGTQGCDTLEFAARHSGNSFQIDGSALMDVATWGLRLDVEKSASEFWQKRIARIEILAIDLENVICGVGGRFASTGSGGSVLSVTPVADVETARVRARARFESEARVEAVVYFPLRGFSGQVLLSGNGPIAGNNNQVADMRPRVARRFGSMTVYVSGAETGVLQTAFSSNPLQLVGSERVCPGQILSVTSPVGSGGGWNYGRHHLLLFSSDGIYGVSIDRTLKVITSTLLHAAGIGRSDAVAATPSAVYVATTEGSLLRLRGSRAEQIESPLQPVAVTYVMLTGELWILGADGRAATIDRRRRCSLRSDVSPVRFVPPGYAIDRSNAVRALARESRETDAVKWCGSVDFAVGGFHRCRWRIESADATDLRLQLLADSGSTPQRLLELTADGPVNSPIEARFASPRRLRLTARLHGRLASSSRLVSVKVSACPRG